ncbi:MAG TPA: hypothetical protein VF756_05850 [Thermoanaerobaculia bacterium]
MGGQDDFADALKAIMAAKRRELGGPPMPEELLAYRDGSLDPAERERLEARIAVYPDAARSLADLAAFPNIEPAPGVPDISEEEVAARWQTFRQRLAELPAPQPAAPEEPREVPVVPLRPHAPSGSGKNRTVHGVPPWWLAAAASAALAVGLGSGFLAGRASRDPVPASAINVAIAELRPIEEGGARASSSAIDLNEEAEDLVLILGLDDPGNFANYKAEIVDAQGTQVWSREGLHPTPLGTFHLSFRRSALGPGQYRINLFGLDKTGQKTRIATYELRLL